MRITPDFTAVIVTSGQRPELLRAAVRSMITQDHSGQIEIIVVFDHVAVDPLTDLSPGLRRSLRTVSSHHTPGLTGGRNTGIEIARGDVIGFCDDDDEWLPHKVAEQLRLWSAHPRASAVSGGILLRSGGADHRLAAPAQVELADLLRSRISSLASSSTTYRRADLLPTGRIGPFDENLPAAYGEDYDMLLRAAHVGTIHALTDPCVHILWDRTSFFSGHWQKLAQGLTYLLRKFPEFEKSPRGAARIAGQIAFAQAAQGNRREAFRWIRAALRRDPLQLRAWAAVPVAGCLVPASWLVRVVEKTGHGL